MIEQHWIVNGTHYQKTLGKKTPIWKYWRIYLNRCQAPTQHNQLWYVLYLFNWFKILTYSYCPYLILILFIVSATNIIIFSSIYVWNLLSMSLIFLFFCVCRGLVCGDGFEEERDSPYIRTRLWSRQCNQVVCQLEAIFHVSTYRLADKLLINCPCRERLHCCSAHVMSD